MKQTNKSDLTSGQVRQSIRTFRDYSDDLVRADLRTFADRLTRLIDFCRSDPCFSTIHDQLVNNPRVDLQRWLVENGDIRLMGFRFPSDLDLRLSTQYLLLVDGAAAPEDFITRVSIWFDESGGDVSDSIRAFADAMMGQLFRDLGYRLGEIEEELPKDETANVSPSSLSIVHIKTESVLLQTNKFTNSQNIQIGNHGAQDNREINLSLTLEEIVEQIDKANVSESVRQEARNRFQQFLAHPLVSAVVGGATSAVLTPK